MRNGRWPESRFGRWLAAAARRLADVIGDCAWLLLPAQRAAALRNIGRVLQSSPDAPWVQTAARRAFRTSARNFLELALIRLGGHRWVPPVEVEWSSESVDLRGPAVVVSAHLGPFDVVAALLARRGHRFVVVAEPMRPRWLDRIVRWLRGHGGIELVMPSLSGLRRVRRALRAGQPAVFLVDTRLARSDVPVRFFGGAVSLPDVAVRLACRVRCPLVLAFAYRTRVGYRVCLESLPMSQVHSRSYGDVGTLFERVVRRVEGAIRNSPEQWVVFRPLWDD